MRSFTRVLLAMALAATSVGLGVINPVFSQKASDNPFTQMMGRGAKKPLKNSENPEFKADRITKPVDLPFMPAYKGKNTQYVTGTAFSHVKGGPSITEQFSVQEPPKAVLDWYKSKFAENDWRMQDNMTGANGVAAMKDHNICQVMTLGPSTKGAKCDFLLRYKFYRATDFSKQ